MFTYVMCECDQFIELVRNLIFFMWINMEQNSANSRATSQNRKCRRRGPPPPPFHPLEDRRVSSSQSI